MEHGFKVEAHPKPPTLPCPLNTPDTTKFPSSPISRCQYRTHLSPKFNTFPFGRSTSVAAAKAIDLLTAPYVQCTASLTSPGTTPRLLQYVSLGSPEGARPAPIIPLGSPEGARPVPVNLLEAPGCHPGFDPCKVVVSLLGSPEGARPNRTLFTT